MTRRTLLALAGMPAAPRPALLAAEAGDTARRREELEKLLRRLPPSKPFERWLKESGELPPDFDALPSFYRIQDPLRREDGSRVTRAEWPRRREQIAKLTEHWLLGSAPPPPGNVEGEVLEKSEEGSYEVWNVQLRFGPGHAARLSVTLTLPKERSGPAPIFLCDGDRYRPWADGAMARGFGFCTHAARDHDDESWAYAELFGPCDWSSFRRRGWSASRVVDWLITLPFVDTRRIYIGGHSRSAKQAMAGAAFDERIAGVIASSPGSGGSMPYRYCDQSFFGESPELLTRQFPDWVHPRVRFFCGREDRIPADSHFVYALIAPRPVMMSTATEDYVESSWAIEQVYRTVQPLWTALGAEKNLAFRCRPGLHATDEATAVAFGEFLLAAAGRTGAAPADRFPFTPFHVWDYEIWAKKNAPRSSPRPLPDAHGKTGAGQWKARRREVLDRVEWLLGDGPAYQPANVTPGEGESEQDAANLNRETVKAPRRMKLRFGEAINGYLFTSAGEGKRPCIVWLGPFCAALGFAGRYRSGESAPTPAVAAGFAALAYDHIGTGGRQAERRDFYARYPRWSLMGKMVLDARHAIDAALALPGVDPKRIYLYGYAMGGMVATIAAALDERVAGVASVAGFTHWRTAAASTSESAVQRHSSLYGWIPRLGPFAGREARIPVDFDEILAAIAPRPALLVAPQLDRHASLAGIEKAMTRARRVYETAGARDALTLQTPYDENRLTNTMHREVVSWFGGLPLPRLRGSA